jgi:aspartyl-tRNA(Asn)/glutamyl-tRNA(Gln) amidotransferase subunit A
MLNKLTIEEAHKGLVKKEFTSVELAKACFDAIGEKDEHLNAFITIMEDKAYQQAEVVDKKINLGKKIGVIEGIPIAIKDNILVKDVKATAGSKMLSSYVAPYNATVTNRLKKAGAVIIGKTNLDEFAMGGSGETSNFGPTKNPHDITKVPGGTSSGSAASVAAHETICSLGSDTGGSVRQPAGFCGVVGLKPTYGRVSRHGLMAMASSFDAVGPITKNVSDAATLLETIAGIDKFDSTTVDRKINFTDNLKKDIKGMKIGVPKEFFLKGMDGAVEKVVRDSIKKFELLGAQIVDVSLPMTKYALSAYYILMPAEVSSNMARYDGVRYGHRAESGNLLEMYLKSRREGLGEEVRRRIMLGTYVLSAGYHDAYYKKAQQVRALIKQEMDKVFKIVDVLVAPTSPTVAYGLGEKIDDPLTMYLSDIFTVSANVSGVPAISIPCGKVNNLPVGLQIIGNYFDESKILNVAYHFENNLK